MGILRISPSEFDKDIELVSLCDEQELLVKESTDISELDLFSFNADEGTWVGKDKPGSACSRNTRGAILCCYYLIMALKVPYSASEGA